MTESRDRCLLVTLYSFSVSQYLHVFINEVTALVPVLRDCHYAFAVYTAERTKQRWPLVLAAQSEKDMSDWVTALCIIKQFDSCFHLYFSVKLIRFSIVSGSALCLQLCLLSDCCCECRGITGPPSRQALWSTTSKGDIMVHEPSLSLEAPAHAMACDLM